MGKKKDKKEPLIASLPREEQEEHWDDLYVKEEGIILEFDPDANTGKILIILSTVLTIVSYLEPLTK